MAAGEMEGFPDAVSPKDLLAAHLWTATLSFFEVDEAEDLRELIDVDKALEGFRESARADQGRLSYPPFYSEDPEREHSFLATAG